MKTIIKAVSVIAVFGIMAGGSAIDSPSQVPMIVCAVCTAWLILASRVLL